MAALTTEALRAGLSEDQVDLLESLLERAGIAIDDFVKDRYYRNLTPQRALSRLNDDLNQVRDERQRTMRPSEPQRYRVNTLCGYAAEARKPLLVEQCNKLLSDFNATRSDFSYAITVLTEMLPEYIAKEREERAAREANGGPITEADVAGDPSEVHDDDDSTEGTTDPFAAPTADFGP